MSDSESNLARSLRDRHIQLIALGGTIGVGLFLGSAKAIQHAGPGLLVAYAVGGIVVFFIMRALGELLAYRPLTGSFAVYADEFCGPFAGFATGWSYWFMWVVTAMAELTAIGIYVHYWLPEFPQWLPGLIALAALYGSNRLAVRTFGELEFWFALVKISAIVTLIVSGLLVIVFSVGELGHTASISNLWTHGGFAPFGILGVLLTLQMVTFAYQGVELIGLTAGEAENPEVVLPKAINGVIFRILIFYLGSLVIIMSLLPWTDLAPDKSPFVLVFEKMHIPGAADIITLVVITAAASSCNSGIFCTGRMLYSLAQRGHAPRALADLNSRCVPSNGVNVSVAVMLIGVVLNYTVPEKAFTWVTSISIIGTLWTWSIIMMSHLSYRRAVAEGRAKASSFRMPGAPFANWLVITFLLAVTAMLWKDDDTRVALYVAPIWFGILGVGYAWSKSKPSCQRA